MVISEKRHLLKHRFQVVKKLGQGTYGKVQLAINKESGQEVAIKTIRKSMIETDQDLVRIRREIQIMVSVRHPHIIHIYEVFENKDKIVLIMQFAAGGELYEHLSARKVFDELEARRIFRQISSAVYYCHKNHVCHRDLKLENILLDEKGNVKIADFGLSNVFDEKHFLNTFCGSPLYASPEIVKGSPYHGPEVDCWSLGVLLYTLVYGAMPFDGANFRRLVKQISESNYYEPKNKSEASGLIRKLLTVDPKKRATIIDVCTDDWVNLEFDNSLLQVSEDLANLTPPPFNIATVVGNPSASNSDPKTSVGKISASSTSSGIGSDVTSQITSQVTSNVTEQQPFDSRLAPTTSEIGREVTTATHDGNNDHHPHLYNHPSQEIMQSKAQNETPEPAKIKTAPAAEVAKMEKSDGKEEKTSEKKGKGKREKSKIVSLKESEIEKNVDTEIAVIDQSPTTQVEEVVIEPKFEEIIVDDDDDAQKMVTDVTTGNDLNPLDVALNVPEFPDKDQAPHPNIEPLPSSPPVEPTLIEPPCPPLEDHKKAVDVPSENRRRDSESTESSRQEIECSTERRESESSKKGTDQPPTPERRPSVPRKVGRLSIPNFLEVQKRSPALKKPVPSYGSIEDAKKKLLERKDSISSDVSSSKDVEHVFPTIPVAEVKQDVERRASVIDTPSLTKGPQGIRFNSIEIKDDVIKGNRKVMSRRQTEPLAMFSTEIKSIELKDDDNGSGGSSQQLRHSATAGTGHKEESLAKGVLKKQLANKVHQRSVEQQRQSMEGGSPSSSLSSLQIPEAVPESPETVSSPSPTKEEVSEVQSSGKKRKQSVKTKLDIKSAKSGSPQQQSLDKLSPGSHSSSASSDQGTISEQQQQTPTTPSSSALVPVTPVLKPSPITRSYKKVTFTKDGSCITETGKIYSKEGPDGKMMRVEKRSKVTHYSSAPSDQAGAAAGGAMVSAIESSSQDGDGQKALTPLTPSSASPRNLSEPFKSSLRKSESISSSGSTDIFDDIFDTWSGDTMFNNMMSPKLKGLLHPSLVKRGGSGTDQGRQRKAKSRAESCDRRDSTSMTSASASLFDADELDPMATNTFTATSSPFSGGSLFKFMRENSNNGQSLLGNRMNMFPDPFPNSASAFDGDNLFNLPSTPFSSRLGRERATSSASGTRNQPIGRCEAYSRSRPASLIRDSFDSTTDPDNYYTVTTPRSSVSSSSKPSANPFIRTVSNSNQSSDGSSDTIKQDDCESEDSVASRKRVEQWLHMSPIDQAMDANNPYATIRRPQSRYARTMSSRLSQDLSDDMNSLPDGDRDVGNGMVRSRRPVSLQMRINLGGSQSPSPVRSRQVYKPSSVYSDPRLNCQWEESVTVPEASTLLQQLQMHGYKNLVNQQILFGPDKKYDDGPLAGQPYRKDFNTNNTSPTTPTNSCPPQQSGLTDDSPTTPTNASVNKPIVTSIATLEIGQPSSSSTNDDQPCPSSSQNANNLPTNGDTAPQSDPTTPTSPSEETVKERIHRKSYYSRFNDEPIRRSSSLTPQMYDWPNFRQSQ